MKKGLILFLLFIGCFETVFGQSNWVTVSEPRFQLSFEMPSSDFVTVDSTFLVFYAYSSPIDSSISLQLAIAEDSTLFQGPISDLIEIYKPKKKIDTLEVFVKFLLSTMNGELTSFKQVGKNNFTDGVEFGVKCKIDPIESTVFMFFRIYTIGNKIVIASSSSDKKQVGILLKNYKDKFLDSIIISG